jgi:hypothetical protein
MKTPPTLSAMTGFTKLFGSIVTSTIWRESNETRIVWVTMLAISDRLGYVAASVPGLASLANVSIEECISALSKLQSPDPWSRTKDQEGKRIVEVEGGWQLLNYVKYRQLGVEVDRKLYLRLKQREHRAQQGPPPGVNESVDCQQLSTVVNTLRKRTVLEGGLEEGGIEEGGTGEGEKGEGGKGEGRVNSSVDCQQMKTVCQQLSTVPGDFCLDGGGGGSGESQSRKHLRPTLAEVKLRCAKCGLPDTEAEGFFNYYESNGWRVGKNPMKAWVSALANWKKHYEEMRFQCPPRDRKTAPCEVGILSTLADEL